MSELSEDLQLRTVEPSEYPLRTPYLRKVDPSIPHLYETSLQSIYPYETYAKKYKEYSIFAGFRPQQPGENLLLATLGFKSCLLGGKREYVAVGSNIKRSVTQDEKKDIFEELLENFEVVAKAKRATALLVQSFPGREAILEKFGFKPHHKRTFVYDTAPDPAKKASIETPIETLTKEQTETRLNQHYGSSELALADYKEFYNDDDYIGTFIAKSEDQKSTVSASVIKESNSKVLSIDKCLLVPKPYLSKWYFVTYVLAGVTLPFSIATFMLLKRPQVNTLLAVLGPCAAMNITAESLRDFFKKVRFPPQPTSALMTAITADGDPEHHSSLINTLIAGIKENIAAEHKISKLNADFTQTDDLYQHIQSKGQFDYTVYMKRLNSVPSTEQSALQGRVFFDPRDY